MALSKEDIEKIAQRAADLVWSKTQPAPLGQTAGGSLHEVDLRTAPANLQLQARLGVDPLVQGLQEAQTAQDLKLDEILTLLKPE